MLREKRQMYERWLQSGKSGEWEMYREKRREAKISVKQAKRLANERWGERLVGNFKEDKKMFFKEVKRVRRGESKKHECVKDENEDVLSKTERVVGSILGIF